MKKIIYSILAIIFLSGAIFIACSKEDSEIKIIKGIVTLKSASVPVTLKSTIIDLISIRDSIGKIAFKKKIPANELRSAYENNDTIKIQQLLGLTDRDIKLLNLRLAVLRERLLLLNLEMQKILDNLKSGHCSNCKLNAFFSNYDKFIAISVKKQNPSKLKSGELEVQPDDCQWMQYTACLILCSAGGPILYWPCAYLCICGYCTGTIPSQICH